MGKELLHSGPFFADIPVSLPHFHDHISHLSFCLRPNSQDCLHPVLPTLAKPETRNPPSSFEVQGQHAQHDRQSIQQHSRKRLVHPHQDPLRALLAAALGLTKSRRCAHMLDPYPKMEAITAFMYIFKAGSGIPYLLLTMPMIFCIRAVALAQTVSTCLFFHLFGYPGICLFFS